MLREIFQLGAPCHTGIVDQNVDLFFPLGERVGEVFDADHLAHIGRNGIDFATIFCFQTLDRFLTGIRLARGNDHLRAIGQKACRDHFANAARAARNHDGLAGHRKQIAEIHIHAPVPPSF